MQYSFIPGFWENQRQRTREREKTNFLHTHKDVFSVKGKSMKNVGGVYIIFLE